MSASAPSPVLRFRALGVLDLRNRSGAPCDGLLRQPKLLGLFAYLALARPRGFHRRDSLVALFWPELDDEHARAALRQSLYKLRRQLPPDVLVTRGDGEVGLAGSRLWCDAHAFEEAVQADAPEEALALYRGDVLHGFHFADASPEFGYWLDAERARLHELALEAGREACAAAESADDLDAAVRWATRVAELAPLDEAPVREQMELLHRRGDRAGALAAFDAWKRRLEEQLELAPSPDMVEFADRLRTAPAPARPARPARAARTISPAALVPAQGAAAARRGRRPWLLGAVVLAIVVLTAILLPLRVDWRDGTAAPAGSRAIVLPFSYRGGEEASYLSEGLVYLFTVALDGEDFRVADPHSVVRRSNESGRKEYDAAAAAHLADGFRASTFLLGSVVEAEGRLQLTAGLYDRNTPDPIASATAIGTTAEVLDLVDQISAELLTASSGRGGSRVTRIASVTTQSLTALKAYLRGERFMGEGRFEDAITAFEDAVAADTLFALAHYRTSVAASWAFRGDLANRAAARAVRNADRLPERERRLLGAHEAYRQGQATVAAELLRELAALYPEDPEVWYRLGEVMLHLGPVRGWPLADAHEPFRRAIELEPARTDAYYHLVQIAAAMGDTANALAYAGLALAAAPTGSRAPQLRFIQGVLQGSQRWGTRLRQLEGADDFTLVSSVYNVAVYLGRPDLARDVARLLVASDRPSETRIFGHLLLAGLELALGRPGSADAQLDSIERLDARVAAEYRALFTLAPQSATDTIESARLLRRLARGSGGSAAASGRGGWKPDDRYAPLPTLYSRGILAAALGRTAEVEEVIRAMGALADSAFAADLATDFELAHPSTAGARADRPVAPPDFTAPMEIMILSPMLSRPARRYAEGRRLEELGQPREALRWYESLMTYSVHDLPWGVPALLDRARIHESLGDTPAAAALYRRFIQLQRAAEDPTLRDAARSRAALLASDRF